MKKFILLALLIVLMQSAFAADAFVAIADIHYNPLAGCEGQKRPCALLKQLQKMPATQWGQILQKFDQAKPEFKHDTDYQLLRTSEQELSRVNQQVNPQFVTVLGDFLVHDFRSLYVKYNGHSSKGYAEFVYKTMAFLAQELRAAFPGKPIFCLLGNNDSDYEDYYTTKTLFSALAPIWGDLLNVEHRQDFQEFARNGYYAVDIPGIKNYRLILLNSVLFSKHARGDRVKQRAEQELSWLENELQFAQRKNQKVLIAGHIPMGIDVYMTLRFYRFTIVSFWHTQYTDAFRALLSKYPDTVTGILMGHIHMDGFELIEINKQLSIPMVQVPSISPIFGNNPSFKVMSFNAETLQLNNFVTYYFNMSAEGQPLWQEEYSFNEIYQPNCKYCNIVQGMSRLSKNNLLSIYYKKYYAVSTNAQPIGKKFSPYYWCGMHTFTAKDYRECVGEE